MKFFITGGTGFVGTRACQLLHEANHQCVAYDLLPFRADVGAGFVKGDIRDREKLTQASRECDAILHLAAAHHDFGITPETFHGVNVEGTRNVCDAAKKNSINKLCFYSSVAVYGSAAPPINESTRPEPASDYGKTKLAAEAVCQEWSADSSDNKCLVIRPTVIFGPDNFANMFTLIRQIDSGRFLRVGAMTNVKSLAYIDNILNATFEVWLADNVQQDSFSIYNYVDKPDLRSCEIVESIYNGLEKNPPRFALPYSLARLLAAPFDIVIGLTGKNLPVSSARITKLARSNTQFESDKIHSSISSTMIPLREGLSRMVEWYRKTGKQQTAVDRRPPAV